MSSFDHQAADRVECSPAKPWGIHFAVLGNTCPRCGWVARAHEASAALASGQQHGRQVAA